MTTENIKTAIEIGSLAGQLIPSNQAYVLNTINTLLYSQQCQKNGNKDEQPNSKKTYKEK